MSPRRIEVFFYGLFMDADLLRTNRRRWKLCWSLLGSAFLLMGVSFFFEPSAPWQLIARVVTGLLLFGGAILGRWARDEQAFLEQPSPLDTTKGGRGSSP